MKTRIDCKVLPVNREVKPYLLNWKELTDEQKKERKIRKAMQKCRLPFKVAKFAAKNVRSFIVNGADPKKAFYSILRQQKKQLRREKRSSKPGESKKC